MTKILRLSDTGWERLRLLLSYVRDHGNVALSASHTAQAILYLMEDQDGASGDEEIATKITELTRRNFGEVLRILLRDGHDTVRHDAKGEA